jgi:hypothetical protein
MVARQLQTILEHKFIMFAVDRRNWFRLNTKSWVMRAIRAPLKVVNRDWFVATAPIPMTALILDLENAKA